MGRKGKPRCYLLAWVMKECGSEAGKGESGIREAGEEEGQEAVVRTKPWGDGKFGKELLAASFRATFRGEEIPRRLPCGWKSPTSYLKVSMPRARNEDVLVPAGLGPEAETWRCGSAGRFSHPLEDRS